MAIECATSLSSGSNPRVEESKVVEQEKTDQLQFDASKFNAESIMPEQYIWPEDETATDSVPDLQVPHIDLMKFLSGDAAVVEETIRLVHEACRKHGFFAVLNHGVDLELIRQLHNRMDEFFGMPLSVKQRAQRKLGQPFGYASSFTGRFSSRLPWKETFTLRYFADKNMQPTIHDYICNSLGEEFSEHAKTYHDSADAMNHLCMKIVELLGLCLGVPKGLFKNLYEDNHSLLRLNYYPTCDKPHLTMGTGPHCDPTSITILHQDAVGGLQVYVDDKWHAIPPTPDALLVNIGDTFMALTNGVYKSCFHRAVVNNKEARQSITFFLCPAPDKVVRAPNEVVEKYPPRRFPDYTWPMLLELTENHYRPDSNTFKVFTSWLEQKNENGSIAPSV